MRDFVSSFSYSACTFERVFTVSCPVVSALTVQGSILAQTGSAIRPAAFQKYFPISVAVGLSMETNEPK